MVRCFGISSSLPSTTLHTCGSARAASTVLLHVAQRMAGGTAGDQHCPASSQALLGSTSTAAEPKQPVTLSWDRLRASGGVGSFHPPHHTSAGGWCAILEVHSLCSKLQHPQAKTPHQLFRAGAFNTAKRNGRQTSERVTHRTSWK